MSSVVSNVLQELLKKKEFVHFNDGKKRPHVDYKVSTGSLKLDDKMQGGFGPGIQMFFGPTESGKTSCALEVMNSFLKEENTYGLFVKAEGRLSDNIKERYSIDFINDSTEFNGSGQCFELKSNDYQLFIKVWHKLVETLPKGARLCCIVDSLDALVDYNSKSMVTTPTVTADLLKHISLSVTECGHLIFFMCQQRAIIQDKYTKSEDTNSMGASGGYAIRHYSDWIFQFGHHDSKASRYENPDKKGGWIGHDCSILIRKSPNNIAQTKVQYPILYNRKGSLVWLEKELAEYMIMWSFLTRKNAHSSFVCSEYLIAETKSELGIDLPESFRSEAKLTEFFNENTKFCEFWADKIKTRIQNQTQSLV